jgi:hypothetical protein
MPTLTFLNSALLAALVAVAGPLLIHLISRRRLPEIRIPSTWLLREVRRENLRHVKLHDYLLLVLRTLIVLLLVLAAARPALRAAGMLGTAGGESAVAIVVDATTSMQAVAADGRSVFEHARKRAEEIIRQTARGDVVLLIVARSPSTRRSTDFVVGREEALAALSRLTPSFTEAATLGPAVAEALRRVALEKKPNREVYVVSDFQRSALTDFAHELGETESSVRLILASASDAPRGNLAIESASAQSAGVGLVRVVIANHSAEAVTVPVRVTAQGGFVSEAAVNVPPEGRATTLVRDPLALRGTVGSNTQADALGAAVETAHIPGDALSVDNDRYLPPSSRTVLRVLIVTGGSSPTEVTTQERRTHLSPALFPSLALEAGGGVGPGPGFVVEEGGPTKLLELDPTRYDLAFLLDLPRLPAAALRALSSYVARGGAVFLAFGPTSDPSDVQTNLLPALFPREAVSAVRVAGRVDRAAQGGFLTLLPSVAGHPIFAGFRFAHGGALTGARFRECLALTPGSTVHVIARFSNGTPALLEAPHQGVLVFTSSLDLSWGDFPTSGSYLPFLRQAAAYLATGRARPDVEHVVGEPLVAFAPQGVNGDAVRCVGAEGYELPIHPRVSGRRMQLVTDPVPSPGVWAFRAGEQILERFAVNADTRESDLARPAPDDLVRITGRSNTMYIKPTDEIATLISRLRHGRELWRELLAAALVLLVVELWLGRTRRSAAAALAGEHLTTGSAGATRVG